MIVFESCDCDCCRRAVATLEAMDASRAGDVGRAEKSLDLASEAVEQRNLWRAIARQLFRQAIFSSPEARQRIIDACPEIAER